MDNIDSQLYSRQLYTIGKNAMYKIAKAKIIVSGMTGVGVEIAKCLILYGCHSVIIHDCNNVMTKDLDSNYYANDNDIGKNRAKTVFKKLSQLNPHVNVSILTETLNINKLDQIDVIIMCDQFPQSQIKINELCRKKEIKFILASTIGVFGHIFCDFGNNFIVEDPTGEDELSGIIIGAEYHQKTIIFETHDIHNLSYGDNIEITYDDKVCYVKIIDIVSKTFFKVEYTSDDVNYIISAKNKTYKQIKQKQTLNFDSLEMSIKQPKFTTVISANDNQEELHKILINIEQFVYKYKRLPNNSEAELINVKKLDFVKKIIYNISYKLSPVDSIIGSIASQEAIKAITGKYTPINQWLYYNCCDILINNELRKKLNNTKIFIVGAGAIGCELLKHLAMIGVGNIFITDMDTIEKSNLNRQFLFRNEHVGKSKSEIAKESILKMNPNMNIIASTTKIAQDTVHIYNDKFFNSLTCVLNALDNIKTRLFVDDLCVRNKCPLIDSGTLGTKGNVQVVIPYNTEPYGASVDAPEKDVPMCTIKNFPYLIEHTIEWAKNMFIGMFTNAPTNFMKYKQDPTIKNDIGSTEKEELLSDIMFIHNNSVASTQECIIFAYKMFITHFVTNIQKLQEEFPLDKTNDDGTQYWSGIKKYPEILCVENNTIHWITTFVESCANLWAHIFGLKKISTKQVTTFIDKKIQNTKPIKQQKTFKKEFPDLKIIDYDVKSIEFEKDSDTNYHIDFITSASNLRAINYSIKPIDKFDTKKIAGKIIPALATTTSLISSLAIIEFIKLVQLGTKSKQYVNTFLNLAEPFIASVEPIYVKMHKIGNYQFCVWDTLEYTNPTLCDLLENINKLINDNVEKDIMVSCRESMLYNSLMGDQESKNIKLKKTIVELIENVSSVKVTDSFFVNVIFMDDNDTDYEPIVCKINVF
jgi:ubiquitin-activating enzyme E1